jgi:hypothetical protein
VRAVDLPSAKAADAHHCGLMALHEVAEGLRRLAANDDTGHAYLAKQRQDLRRSATDMHEAMLEIAVRRRPITWRFRDLRPGRPMPRVVDPSSGEVLETAAD